MRRPMCVPASGRPRLTLALVRDNLQTVRCGATPREVAGGLSGSPRGPRCASGQWIGKDGLAIGCNARFVGRRAEEHVLQTGTIDRAAQGDAAAAKQNLTKRPQLEKVEILLAQKNVAVGQTCRMPRAASPSSWGWLSK
ncbi:MAG: hypothetical protein IPL03_18735 [Sterolibacteriaceae bacterium]|nr:hypothetical protein [Candidatus Methylophosphatis haderslevensis]